MGHVNKRCTVLKHRVNTHLTDKYRKLLDLELIDREGTLEAAVIREIIQQYLDKRRKFLEDNYGVAGKDNG